MNAMPASDKQHITIFWFRRDLRLDDNKALYYALKSSQRVLPLFIFDHCIIDKLQPSDHRVEYIFNLLSKIHRQLKSMHSGLLIKIGVPADIFRELICEFQVEAVFCNADHEPYGQQRDQQIRELLEKHNIPMHQSLDHLVMEKNEVLKADGLPYRVFTPYSREWKKVLNNSHLKNYPSGQLSGRFFTGELPDFPSMKQLGFSASGMAMPVEGIREEIIADYDKTRDFPFLDGTSRVGPQLRFGAISIRRLTSLACSLNETYLNELIWREFYAMILWHFPKVAENAFKPEYDRIAWRNDEAEFESWCQGATGYPMVDAGMRQLNKTGFMHNRLRMITASFLCKHLLIDWRWGMSYFDSMLFDYELSSNNGGWQWCAGSGTDAAPYFRIFNPMEQQKKFDPDKLFIKQWIPEFGTEAYPSPVVDHRQARLRCLQVYQLALKQR